MWSGKDPANNPNILTSLHIREAAHPLHTCTPAAWLQSARSRTAGMGEIRMDSHCMGVGSRIASVNHSFVMGGYRAVWQVQACLSSALLAWSPILAPATYKGPKSKLVFRKHQSAIVEPHRHLLPANHNREW